MIKKKKKCYDDRGGHTKGLPVEILEKIFSSLSAKDLWACLGVSRQWRYVANSDRFWKTHCLYVGIYENAVSNLSGNVFLISELILSTRVLSDIRVNILISVGVYLKTFNIVSYRIS